MNKLKQVFSHDSDVERSPNEPTINSHVGDRVEAGFEDRDRTSGVGSSSTGKTGVAGAAATAASAAASGSHSHSTHDHAHNHGVEGAAASAREHIEEHAHAPHHTHNQPKRDAILSEADAKRATHDHQHLAAVTHETRHHHEIEEIERQREIDRHVHHVQHHVQPVLDTQHAAEVHHEKVVPVTQIKENHVATDEDKAQFAALKTAQDTVVEAPREKVIIDKGERVVENVAHHVHHVVQPQIERDVHEHHRIHTVIPVHQTTHEAPIVHSSVQHEPMSLADFTAGGGDLSSKLKHDADAILSRHTHGDCERTVDGPAETLVEQFGLTSLNDKNSTSARPSTTIDTNTSTRGGPVGTTGAVGTGAGSPVANPSPTRV